MGFSLKALIRVVAPIVGTLGGPIGTVAGGAVASLLPEEDQDQFKEWCKYAEKLGKDDDLDNEQRAAKLTGRIRADLYADGGAIPEARQVNWLRETVVMSFKGDWTEEDSSND